VLNKDSKPVKGHTERGGRDPIERTRPARRQHGHGGRPSGHRMQNRSAVDHTAIHEDASVDHHRNEHTRYRGTRQNRINDRAVRDPDVST
jgi:hypothetical protein